MRTEQFPVKHRCVTQGRHGFLFCTCLLGALRYPLLDSVLQVRAQFVFGLTAFQERQSRHCLAEKAFRFRRQARH